MLNVSNNLNSPVAFQGKKYTPKNEKTREELDKFYKNNPKINNGSAFDPLNDAALPAFALVNTVSLGQAAVSASQGQDPVAASIALDFLAISAIAGANLKGRHEVVQAACNLAEKLVEAGVDDEDVKGALGEVASYNKHLPFGYVGPHKRSQITQQARANFQANQSLLEDKQMIEAKTGDNSLVVDINDTVDYDSEKTAEFVQQCLLENEQNENEVPADELAKTKEIITEEPVQEASEE